MTAMTLDAANNSLTLSGITLRVTQQGFNFIQQQHRGFLKAVEFCTTNQQAKQDVLRFLSEFKTDNSLVYVGSDGSNQVDTPANTHNSNSEPVQQQPAPQEHALPETHRAEHHDHHQEQPQEQRDFVGHHVYGGSGALYFVLDETRAGANTIAIDGTKGANKQYNWKEKVRLQITRGDLPSMAAVFFGLTPECELSNYGADNTKRLSVKNQGNKFFLNMSAKGSAQIAVPIMASDVFEIRALFLRQLLASSPEIGVEGVLANLKCHAFMLNHK